MHARRDLIASTISGMSRRTIRRRPRRPSAPGRHVRETPMGPPLERSLGGTWRPTGMRPTGGDQRDEPATAHPRSGHATGIRARPTGHRRCRRRHDGRSRPPAGRCPRPRAAARAPRGVAPPARGSPTRRPASSLALLCRRDRRGGRSGRWWRARSWTRPQESWSPQPAGRHHQPAWRCRHARRSSQRQFHRQPQPGRYSRRHFLHLPGRRHQRCADVSCRDPAGADRSDPARSKRRPVPIAADQCAAGA